ncbi:PP0621 family protein [Hippea maritima]|uniref:TRASH domain-containing protein n=1 Tax=Hippea maritima (strain ATCC 700847 / DSM 10411 / MH2) TaxID=760142 RepID=F2LUS6_HIPMA|nr:PP0621 family protein [Hippea maritima]AEA33531.1 TRASH domain-containing protein [Hippea maritima DSM 10411]
MLKILFFIFLLFLFVTIYSFKKRVDNILDAIFPPKNKTRRSSNQNSQPEQLVKCANCGVYLPKSDAVKKIKLNGEIIYFCSEACKREYKSKK